MCVVSLPIVCLHESILYLRNSLASSCISELKWTEVTSAKYRFAGQKFIDWAVDLACRGLLRIDVLCWDMDDTRHKDVFRRDDIADLERMYYHLLRDVFRRRWPDDARWKIFLDFHSALNSDVLKRCLSKVGLGDIVEQTLFGGSSLKRRSYFHIISITQVDSAKKPLVQLADLMVGLSIFSREKYDLYNEWIPEGVCQLALPFSDMQRCHKLTSSQQERFKLLRYFDEACKRHKMGVSLKSQKRLQTKVPDKPIRIWWWEPQGEYDKAPTKERRR